MNEQSVRTAKDPADAGDLAGAVLRTLRTLRGNPGALADEEAATGLSPEALEAVSLTGLFFEWLARQEGGFDPVAFDLEAGRATIALVESRVVAMGTRLPALLAMRVLELAGRTHRSADAVLCRLVGDHVDAALAAADPTRPVPPWGGRAVNDRADRDDRGDGGQSHG